MWSDEILDTTAVVSYRHPRIHPAAGAVQPFPEWMHKRASSTAAVMIACIAVPSILGASQSTPGGKCGLWAHQPGSHRGEINTGGCFFSADLALIFIARRVPRVRPSKYLINVNRFRAEFCSLLLLLLYVYKDIE